MAEFGAGLPTAAAFRKYDMRSGASEVRQLQNGRAGGEPVFVPAAGATGEDDGYLLSFVYDPAENKSELIILDASNIAQAPIARVHLPVRVPAGFHGSGVADSAWPSVNPLSPAQATPPRGRPAPGCDATVRAELLSLTVTTMLVPPKLGTGMGTRAFLLTSVVVTLLTSCAGIDFDVPKTESHARADTGQTALGKRAKEVSAGHPGHSSGFLLQTDGVEALATRLTLANLAEVSIDAQYYLIGSDPAARLFVESLLEAADRGVRVRLLLDDILTKGYDLGMAALDSHPNFEIRIFNPFARGLRGLNAARDFSRVNRRMHNKTFTVDNVVTIIGGRNIAAEYFAAADDVNFGDLDALAVGAVVKDVSGQFDSYWNDDYAVPVSSFLKVPDDPEASLERMRRFAEESREELEKTPYIDSLNRSIEGLVGTGDRFTWAPYELIYDAAEKARKETLEGDFDIVNPLRKAAEAATKELIIASPYFVPSKDTIEAAGVLTARGVDVIVITNSLASNNHAVVHSGYAPRRKRLLEHGVKLYEVRPDAPVSGVDPDLQHLSEGTLHTKAFIVDGEVLFLGSFNFDPRSRNINTELGVIIESPELAQPLAQRAHDVFDEATYRVELDERGRLRWITHDDGQEIVYTHEPETSWWLRTKVNLMKLLPIKGQL